jgi:hypothetical protein
MRTILIRICLNSRIRQRAPLVRIDIWSMISGARHVIAQ